MLQYEDIYNQQALENNLEANNNRPYQQCEISLMDTIADPNINFDKNGICNYYYDYKKAEAENCLLGDAGKAEQEIWANKIKAASGKNGYNCILGLSGGADSTYLAFLAKQLGLKPLLVHFDYGWNTEIATKNVELAVKNSGFDLHTVVMDWPEFKNLQRSYFKASVLDLDVPADHMIFGALFKVAKQYGIKFVLSGNNIWTEYTLPKTWNYNKFDIVNLRNIHKKFENTSLNHLPALGLWESVYMNLGKNIQRVAFLNWQEYNRAAILKIIEKELGWINYGGKHQESVFTRFYQGYILPKKFNIDKRKAHLSDLIFAGQITKQQALDELKQPPYDVTMMQEDLEYVAKKLGFTNSEFEALLNLPNVPHEYYGTDQKQQDFYFKMMRTAKPITSILKKFIKR